MHETASAEPFRPHPRPIPPKLPPAPESRRDHAAALVASIEASREQALGRRAQAAVEVEGSTPGIYVEFASIPGFDLKLESLEARRSGIELLCVTRDERGTERASVFIPDGKVGQFLRRFQQYAGEETRSGAPRHRDMVERIGGARLATLRRLWTDAPEEYPRQGQSIWWEVWLRRRDGREVAQFEAFARAVGLTLGVDRLAFDDRTVVLVHGSSAQLSASVDVLDAMAEVRKAKEADAVFIAMPIEEQVEWANDLRGRLRPPRADAPAVCVLDTGITREHPLLTEALAPGDMHACRPDWGSHDHDGHGTEMAGLALYGELGDGLRSSLAVELKHRLESVKVLPPPGQPANAPELYGALTAECAALVEVEAPERRRAFSLAITSTDARDRGQPTSWSAAIDALAAGRSIDQYSGRLDYLDDQQEAAPRLFVVSAGNVDRNRQLVPDHLDLSDSEPIHDPAQAWNALTVGAFTELCSVDGRDRDFAGWSPLAPAGELSPYSTTSVPFARAWPIKPDVVAEGGNAAISPSGRDISTMDSLSLVTTHYLPAERLFTSTGQTSAATAQVAHIAGLIAADYPGLWPEAIRALIVQSARWTPRMLDNFGWRPNKTRIEAMVRRYGFGVPSSVRALRSAADALTLVAQETIRPFNAGKMREMNVHELPWPRDALESLAAHPVPVRLRVTLSYFVEPNPGHRGWRRRHRYASHGLRFEVKAPSESVVAFRKRLNQQALEEDEGRPRTPDTKGWLLGSLIRSKGSLHSDVWEGTAAELAACGCIAVYPVSGWWKELPTRDRSDVGARYALVVSIETPEADVDIWTPVAQMVGIPVEVEL